MKNDERGMTMKRWQRLFFLTVVCHFGLTVATGLVWNELITALNSHRSPALLHAVYASFYVFFPFCQPVFWPLSDWVAHSGHFNLFTGPVWQCVELLVLAFINSLIASGILFSLVGIINITRKRRRKLPVVS